MAQIKSVITRVWNPPDLVHLAGPEWRQKSYLPYGNSMIIRFHEEVIIGVACAPYNVETSEGCLFYKNDIEIYLAHLL